MTVEIITPPAMARWRDVMRPEFRRRMYAAIADRVENLVRRHILRIAPAHHVSATPLGAQPTGHLEKGARATTAHAGSDFAEVVIPIAGISRAFKPLSITPRKAQALTIPIAAQSYGHRVSEMRRHGWAIFRPRRSQGDRPANTVGILMGRPQGGGEAVPLYVLKRRVDQKQDRSLLPSDDAIGAAANAAITGTLDRIAKGAA